MILGPDTKNNQKWYHRTTDSVDTTVEKKFS